MFFLSMIKKIKKNWMIEQYEFVKQLSSDTRKGNLH
jgi:hypothetical protein